MCDLERISRGVALGAGVVCPVSVPDTAGARCRSVDRSLIVRENRNQDSRPHPVRPISLGMTGVSEIVWLGIGLLAGLGVLQMLRALAIFVRNETMIHDLKVGVAKIQVERFHAEMLRHGMSPDGPDAEGEFEMLDPDVGSPPANARAATPDAAETAKGAEESADHGPAERLAA